MRPPRIRPALGDLVGSLTTDSQFVCDLLIGHLGKTKDLDVKEVP
jgi:hypothetical protein